MLEKIREEINCRLENLIIADDECRKTALSKHSYEQAKYFQNGVLFTQRAKNSVEEVIRQHMNDDWIPVDKRLPEEHTCIDEETGYYGRSDDVLCSAYNEYTGEYEIWIDYTIDGEWQTHEWYEGEQLAWQPLPKPYKPKDND